MPLFISRISLYLIAVLTLVLPSIVHAESEKVFEPARVYWNDATRFEFPLRGYSLNLNLLQQLSYRYQDATSQKNKSSFENDVTRVGIQGELLGDLFSYQLVTDFQRSEAEEQKNYSSSQPQLLDAVISFHQCECSYLKAGQFKTPVSRSYNAEQSQLQFLERLDFDRFFSSGRQPGVEAGYKFLENKLLARVGVWNGLSLGEGINTEGVDTKHQVALAIDHMLAGLINPGEEADLKSSELSAGWGLAYSYRQESRALSNELEDRDRSIHTLSIYFSLKNEGLNFNTEIFSSQFRQAGSENRYPVAGYLQVGNFILGSQWELVGRYGFSEFDHLESLRRQHQASLGLNYYMLGHHLKLQFGYDRLFDYTDVYQRENRVGLKVSSWW